MSGLGYEVTRRSGAAFWAWTLQRLTAIALFPLLFLHMIVNHYLDPGTIITTHSIALNLNKVSYIIVDSVLLVFTLFHGLNGVRNVAYDYVNDDRSRRLISFTLFTLGAVFVLFGFAILFKLMEAA